MSDDEAIDAFLRGRGGSLRQNGLGRQVRMNYMMVWSRGANGRHEETGWGGELSSNGVPMLAYSTKGQCEETD